MKISNVRINAIHHATSYISRNPVTVAIEDLNVMGMLKNKKLAAAVSDAAMSEQHRQIKYKTSWRGGDVYVADQWFASSKTCSCCGVKKDSLSLAERTFKCDSCGFTAGRDANAAINLEKLARFHLKNDNQ